MERHALAFRVRPGTEASVAELLSNYDPPALEVDGRTRLLATAVFMRDNLVVRNIEIEGDINVVSRHIASDPNVRRIEAELSQYLEEPYDPADPVARQGFFRSRLMDRVMHVESNFEVGAIATPERFALRYPVKAGAARAVAQVFIDAGQLPMRIGDTLVHSTTLFVQRDDTLVRVMTIEGDNDAVVAALSKSPAIHAMAEKLADKWTGTYDFHSVDGMGSFFRTNVLETVLERDGLAARDRTCVPTQGGVN